MVVVVVLVVVTASRGDLHRQREPRRLRDPRYRELARHWMRLIEEWIGMTLNATIMPPRRPTWTMSRGRSILIWKHRERTLLVAQMPMISLISRPQLRRIPVSRGTQDGVSREEDMQAKEAYSTTKLHYHLGSSTTRTLPNTLTFCARAVLRQVMPTCHHPRLQPHAHQPTFTAAQAVVIIIIMALNLTASISIRPLIRMES